MVYKLYLGDRTFSSWSLRGWLLVEKFDIAAAAHFVRFAEDATVREQMGGDTLAPTVPTLVLDDGIAVWDSLAIAEELASRHPEAGIWPKDAKARAIARTLAAEMHSGFSALRGDCPMNLSTRFLDTEPSEAVRADLARIEEIWAYARTETGSEGPWLCGEYSAVDAFFAPVAARIAGYSLPVEAEAEAYVAAHLADPAFRAWRAIGLVQDEALARYAKQFATAPWPGPHPLPARAVKSGTPENATCPYSGKAPEYLAEIGGRIFGFCNAGCRDKTMIDAEAFPQFMAIYQT